MSSEPTRPAPQLRARLRAVTLGRLLALTSVSALLGTTGRSMVDPEGWALLAWAGAAYLAVILIVLVLPADKRVQRVALDVSLLADAAALGITLAVTGGPASPLAFLLYAEVVALTLVFGWWTGVRICVLLSLALLWAASTGPPSLVAIVDAVRDSDLAMASALDPTVRTVLLLLGLWFVAALVASLSTVTERELRGLINDLAVLRQVNHELDATQSLAQVSSGVAHTLVETFGYDRAVVWLLNDDELTACGGAGLDPTAADDLGNRSVSAKSYPLHNALRAGEPWPVRRDEPRPGALERMLGEETPLVLVPLGTDERVIGLISAEVPRRLGRPPRLRERDVRLLSMLAGEASLVLDNARLHSELSERAVTDALTGLPNHGFFQQRLQEEVDRLSRKFNRGESGELAVALFDLDHFKAVNDTFGHPTGDRVLRAVAQSARRVLRSADVVCRYGGEEFAVILPDTTGPQAVRTCERIRAALHGLEITADDGRPVGRITGSFGVSSSDAGLLDRSSMLAEADAALYLAKGAGRDRIMRAMNDQELSPAAG